MKKLITEVLGGVPLEWDDLRFMDEGVREAFTGLFSAFGITPSESFIISGGQVTGTAPSQSIGSGYVCLNGEILPILAGPIPAIVVAGDFHYFDLRTAWDASGLETTEQGTTVNTYQLRFAEVKVGQPAPGTYMPLDADRLDMKLAKLVDGNLPSVNQFQRPWNLVQLHSSAGPGVVYCGSNYQMHPSYPMRWRLDSCGNVWFIGQLECTLSNVVAVNLIHFSNVILPDPSLFPSGFVHIYDSSGVFKELRPVRVVMISPGEYGIKLVEPAMIPLANEKVAIHLCFPAF